MSCLLTGSKKMSFASRALELTETIPRHQECNSEKSIYKNYLFRVSHRGPGGQTQAALQQAQAARLLKLWT